MKLYSLYLDDVVDDHWSYPVEMIKEDDLQQELSDLKQDIINHPEQYETLVDVEVVEVDTNGDALNYGIYHWLDEDDCPEFMIKNWETCS